MKRWGVRLLSVRAADGCLSLHGATPNRGAVPDGTRSFAARYSSGVGTDVLKLDHVGIVIQDLDAAEQFLDRDFEREAEAQRRAPR